MAALTELDELEPAEEVFFTEADEPAPLLEPAPAFGFGATSCCTMVCRLVFAAITSARALAQA
ncbi:MAG TPA: hypothetical protein PLL50_08755 [Propionicimonas sp.]|nr:hypothetical protein [Propionicimonas sp.]